MRQALQSRKLAQGLFSIQHSAAIRGLAAAFDQRHLALLNQKPTWSAFGCLPQTSAGTEPSTSGISSRRRRRPAACANPPSNPCPGKAILAVIVSEAIDSVRKADLQALRCYFGVAPVTKRSGRTILVQRRLAANRRLADAACHRAMAARPGELPCAAKPRPQPRAHPPKRSGPVPERRLQDDRNRTDLRSGTAINRSVLKLEKKLDVTLRAPPPGLRCN